jgi:hypothetical protein
VEEWKADKKGVVLPEIMSGEKKAERYRYTKRLFALDNAG